MEKIYIIEGTSWELSVHSPYAFASKEAAVRFLINEIKAKPDSRIRGMWYGTHDYDNDMTYSILSYPLYPKE